MAERAISRGERLYLRRVSVRDEDRFVAAVRRSRRLHRPWVELPDTPQDFTAFMRSSRRSDTAAFVICLSGDGELAGVANLTQIFLGTFRSAYLGFSAFEPLAGQGYMTEGLGLVLRHAFGPMGLHRVEANVQPGNARSIALVERLGFRREGYSPRYLKISGRWRDHVRYAILAEELGRG